MLNLQKILTCILNEYYIDINLKLLLEVFMLTYSFMLAQTRQSEIDFLKTQEIKDQKIKDLYNFFLLRPFDSYTDSVRELISQLLGQEIPTFDDAKFGCVVLLLKDTDFGKSGDLCVKYFENSFITFSNGSLKHGYCKMFKPDGQYYRIANDTEVETFAKTLGVEITDKETILDEQFINDITGRYRDRGLMRFLRNRSFGCQTSNAKTLLEILKNKKIANDDKYAPGLLFIDKDDCWKLAYFNDRSFNENGSNDRLPGYTVEDALLRKYTLATENQIHDLIIYMDRVILSKINNKQE